jgi:hypothetical protein
MMKIAKTSINLAKSGALADRRRMLECDSVRAGSLRAGRIQHSKFA